MCYCRTKPFDINTITLSPSRSLRKFNSRAKKVSHMRAVSRKVSKLAGGISSFTYRYPVVRGMISYAVIWPCCSLTQEYLEFGKTLSEANWIRAARFGFFGAFFMSPVFYNWMRITSKMKIFRAKTLATAIKRAAIEQVSYGPLALCYFLFGMSVLELKSFDECVEEVKQKFWTTYKTGAVYWPVTQTLNFYFISDRNRIIFVSFASYVWTCYLAHIKSMSASGKGVVSAKGD